jgi:hypothetical protein
MQHEIEAGESGFVDQTGRVGGLCITYVIIN